MNAHRSSYTAALLLLWGGLFAQQVDNAEYFWDADPGAGNGTAMSAEDGAFGQAVEAIFFNTGSLPGLGAHTLGIRVMDRNNNWGPLFRTVVVIDPSVVTAPDIKVTTAEYFWDTDPGAGNGTAMLAFDGNYDAALEAIAMETGALPSIGAHTLNVRARDANGTWSTPFQVVVDVLAGSVSFPSIKVNAAEYYVNTDPGVGFGTPMLAVDGNFDAAWEAIMGGGIPAPVLAGVNVLWMRAKDANDAWGPSFGIVVNIDTTITGTVGLYEPMAERSWTIQPNPADAANGLTIVLGPSSGQVSIRLVDVQGRLLLATTQVAKERIDLPLDGLASGVYHIGLSANDIMTWKKVIVR